MAARCSGVVKSFIFMLTVAPLETRAFTTSRWPFSAAWRDMKKKSSVRECS